MVERRVKVYLDGDISSFNRALIEVGAGAKAFSRELNTSSDRMTNLTQTALALGPALVPITAAAVPAVAGLSNQLGIAAAGVGVAVLAFHGFGKALDAVNQYSIEPTDANLKKMNDTMASIGPAGRDFVLFLQRARPEMQHLQDLAQAGLFPGLEEGLRLMSGLLPDVENVISTIATTIGGLADEAGKNLDSPKWHEFIAFIDAEARPTLQAMAYTTGNLIEGFANLWMAFGPLSNNFSKSFLQMARDFNSWTEGLAQTQGFQDFIAYIDKAGPEAWSTLGAIANALLQIVEAAAPVGTAVLPIITALANMVAAFANSPLGPPLIAAAAGISALSRALFLLESANAGSLGKLFGKSVLGGIQASARDLPAATRAYLDYGAALDSTGARTAGFATTSDRLGASLKSVGKLAGGAGGLAFVMSGAADSMGVANTASLALAGSMFGPVGAALGAGAGAVKDFQAANEGLANAVKNANTAIASGDYATMTAALKALNAELDKSAKGQEGFGQKVIDTSGRLEHVFGLIGAAGPGILDHFTKSTDEGASAQDKLATATEKARIEAQNTLLAENGLAGQMANASQKARDQVASMLALRDAINAAKNEALTAANANLAYEQALDDAAAGAAKNKKSLDANLPAGRANLQLLYVLAGSWNNLTDAQRNVPGASERVRKAFYAAALQMSGNRAEAKKLTEQYLGIPDKVATQIQVNGEKEAKAAIKAVKDLLANLPGSKNINITTHYATTGKPGQKQGSTRADGGYITGPGGPRDDVIPAWLSNGEFVVNAAATKANLGLLHQINAQKFAEGGPVLQRMASGGRGNTPQAVAQSMSVSLVGAKVSLDSDGFATFVDGRIDLVNAGDLNYAASNRRGGR